jgi:hypothetical protein
VTSTKRDSVSVLQRQIAALKQRVTWLERALRPKPAKAVFAGHNAG